MNVVVLRPQAPEPSPEAMKTDAKAKGKTMKALAVPQPVKRKHDFELTIDPRLRDLIPKVSDQSFKEMEASIVETGGPEKPLVVWNGVLVDGHHRYRICQKKKLPFTTVERKFESIGDAMMWTINEHLTRRNMTPDQLHTVRHRKVALRMEIMGESKVEAIEHAASTEGVDRSTVRRSFSKHEQRQKLLDSVPDDVREKVEELPVLDLRVLSGLPEDKQREVVAEHGGDKKALSKSLRQSSPEVSAPLPSLPSIPPLKPSPSKPNPPQADGIDPLVGEAAELLEKLTRFYKALHEAKEHVWAKEQFLTAVYHCNQIEEILIKWRDCGGKGSQAGASDWWDNWGAKNASEG